MTSRRQFLAVAGAVAVPSVVLGQSRPLAKDPAEEGKSPHLSQAVMHGATLSIQRLTEQVKLHKQTKADVREAVVASRMTFAHMEETGFNTWLTEQVLTHPSEAPTEDEKTFHENLRNLGLAALEAVMLERISTLESAPDTIANASFALPRPWLQIMSTCKYLAVECFILARYTPPPEDAYFLALGLFYGWEAEQGWC